MHEPFANSQRPLYNANFHIRWLGNWRMILSWNIQIQGAAEILSLGSTSSQTFGPQIKAVHDRLQKGEVWSKTSFAIVPARVNGDITIAGILTPKRSNMKPLPPGCDCGITIPSGD